MSMICSADCHLIEPADLWTSRMPEGLRDRAPKYEYSPTHRFWHFEGRPFLKEPLAIESRPDGSLIPEDVPSRLKELDGDGVWAETIFGNMAPFCLAAKDPAYGMAMARAFNDYLAEHFGPYRNRELGIAMIPIRDVPMAVAEINRVVKLGIRGITLPMTPHQPYFLEEFEPIWATAADLGLPISFHVGTGLHPFDTFGSSSPFHILDPKYLTSQRAFDAATTISSGIVSLAPTQLLGTLIGAGILERHPKLHIVFVEAGAGWLAPAMEAMDFAWTAKVGADREAEGPISLKADGTEAGGRGAAALFKRGDWPYPLRPGEYVRRQVHVTFMDEAAPLKFRHVTGVDALMWGSDFPHPEGTWPHSQEITGRLFRGVPQSEKDAILGETLAKLYGIERPAAA
jgi:predicted TIM-barrel fold metal-dependent hydrolase